MIQPAVGAPATVTPVPDRPVAAPSPGDAEVLSLLAQGRILAQCGFPDLAWPMYQAALTRTAEPQMANWRLRATCEAVICLLSKHWEASHECKAEFRYAETLSKTILRKEARV